MKKIKEISQKDLEKILPKKEMKNIKKAIEKALSEDNNCGGEDCRECNNAMCKAHQIMENLNKNVSLAEQINHQALFNILLTISLTLQNLSTQEKALTKIERICCEVYGELNPKEMGHTLN